MGNNFILDNFFLHVYAVWSNIQSNTEDIRMIVYALLYYFPIVIIGLIVLSLILKKVGFFEPD